MSNSVENWPTVQKFMHIEPDLQIFVVGQRRKTADGAFGNVHTRLVSVICDNGIRHHLQQRLRVEVSHSHTGWLFAGETVTTSLQTSGQCCDGKNIRPWLS
jgi:hypothetical protein